MLKLDHQSSIPLRAQVEQLLRELVRLPKYQRGALLPDEVKLATRLGISRGTVRSGISKLVFEGVLERKAGVGTRVSPRRIESGIHAWRSFTREMSAKGVKVQNFRLDYRLVAPSAEAAKALQLNSATQVWRLDRVRGWNGKPVLQSTSWFHPRLGLKGDEDFTSTLYKTLERTTAVRPHHAHEVSRQAEAERERRARIITADGEYQASKRLAAAANVMSRDPAALQLRLLQTVVEVAGEKNSTLVMPVPVELLRFFEKMAPGPAAPASEPAGEFDDLGDEEVAAAEAGISNVKVGGVVGWG